MSGNKAMKRACSTSDAVRLGTDLPLISDSTELITPELAQEYLKRNRNNRPINWRKVEEYSKIMKTQRWELHSQGLIFDEAGDILTGQTRLWAVVYSGISVYMRVSRGNPRRVANLIDRGRPQSARDLSTRVTERKHSPIEASIARAICALRGDLRPSVDVLSETITANSEKARAVISETSGAKKTRTMLMILAAICFISSDRSQAKKLAVHTQRLSERLERLLLPQTADKCWGKGAAFSLAMEHARSVTLTQEVSRASA